MKQKYLVIIAGLALGLGGTVLSVENQSGTSAPKLIRLKSNGETIAELRILKSARFSIAAKEAKYNTDIHRWTLKGDVRIEIKHEGGSPVLVKAHEIESVSNRQ